MGFSLENRDLDIASVADGEAVEGRINERKASLLIKRVGKTNFSDDVIKDFEDNMIHSNVAVYLGEDPAPGTDFVAYGFETSGFTFSDFKQGEKRYADAKNAFSQILQGIVFLHSKGFGINNLDRGESFLFSEVGSSITVKIMPYNCYRLGSDALEEKKSNVRSFGKLLTTYFFGDKVNISKAAAYDVVRNAPPIRNVPVFKLGATRLRPYICETVHAIKCANDPPNSEEPAVCLKYVPFSWTSNERMEFFQDGWERISDLDSGHSVISSIDNMKGFSQVLLLKRWHKLCPELIKDLRFYQASPRPSQVFGGLTSSNGSCTPYKEYVGQESMVVGVVSKEQKLSPIAGRSVGCSTNKGYVGQELFAVWKDQKLRSVVGRSGGSFSPTGYGGQELSAFGAVYKEQKLRPMDGRIGVCSSSKGYGGQESSVVGGVLKKQKIGPTSASCSNFKVYEESSAVGELRSSKGTGGQEASVVGVKLRSIIVGPSKGSGEQEASAVGSTSKGTGGQETPICGVKLRSLIVGCSPSKGSGGKEASAVSSTSEGTGEQEASTVGFVEIEQKEKFKPTRGSACDLLRCLRNVKVHCVRTSFYKGLSGAETYKKFDYDSEVISGFDALLSATLPLFLLTVYEALVKSLEEDRKDGLPVGDSLDKYLKYAFIPKNP